MDREWTDTRRLLGEAGKAAFISSIKIREIAKIKFIGDWKGNHVCMGVVAEQLASLLTVVAWKRKSIQ